MNIGASQVTTTQRRRKGKPFDPGKDFRNSEIVPIEIDDPYALDPGVKAVAMRSTKDDPLGKLHSRRQIDDAQYHAGREFQNDFEIAERGPCAIDPGKEAVDGGRMPEPITERQQQAVERLNGAQRRLGADGSALIHAILIRRQTCAQVAQSRALTGEGWEKYFGKRFRECLDCLALFYGFAMERR